MRYLAPLVLVALLGSQAKACNPVGVGVTASFAPAAVLTPQFGFVGSSFTPFGVIQPGFGFNAFNGFNSFGFNSFGVNAFAAPFGFGGVNVAVNNVGVGRGRAFVGGRGRATVRTRTVVRTR